MIYINMKRVIFCIISMWICYSTAQDFNTIQMCNKIYHEDILSMKMEKNSQLFALPVIMLNSNEKLTLRFDDKSDNFKYLRYTFIHCTYNWEPTMSINKSEYMDRFEDMEIRDFQTSINTLQFYTSYTITFPNEDLRMTKSGNYILYVYDEDTDEPILTHRFCVSENAVNISLTADRANDISKRMTPQQLSLTINH